MTLHSSSSSNTKSTQILGCVLINGKNWPVYNQVCRPNGDRVIALKWQNITLVGLRLEHQEHPFQRSHVAVDGSELYWYC